MKVSTTAATVKAGDRITIPGLIGAEPVLVEGIMLHNELVPEEGYTLVVWVNGFESARMAEVTVDPEQPISVFTLQDDRFTIGQRVEVTHNRPGRPAMLGWQGRITAHQFGGGTYITVEFDNGSTWPILAEDLKEAS